MKDKGLKDIQRLYDDIKQQDASFSLYKAEVLKRESEANSARMALKN